MDFSACKWYFFFDDKSSNFSMLIRYMSTNKDYDEAVSGEARKCNKDI